MKVGLATSLTLHAAALGFGLFSLSAPAPLQAVDVESFPIDIVPMEEFAQSVQGDREAPAAERPAPVPTTRPEPVEDAQNVGDNTVDLDTAPTPDPRPRPVETAAAPPPEPEPTPRPAEATPEPEPAPQPAPPEPAPTTEVAPEPQPQQEVMPDPAPEPAVTETAQAEAFNLPQSAPTPQSRPQPPQAQSARTPERREPERQPQREQTAQQQSQEREFDADQIAALLNQDRPSGGGAQRSEQQAALGGRQTTGTRLAQSEIDGLRSQIQRCWNVPAGVADAQDLKVTIRMRLNQTGEIDGSPEIVAGAGNSTAGRAATEAARRAVLRCAPYNMPTDKYDAWSEVVVNFDPRDMF